MIRAGRGALLPALALLRAFALLLAAALPAAGHIVYGTKTLSQLVAEAPILGAGINTARALNDRQGPVAPGSDFRLTTSLHSHNAYLQTWYETGAVGAALLMAVGLAVIAPGQLAAQGASSTQVRPAQETAPGPCDALMREVAGVRYVDDSKGTNVGATLAAVAGLRGPLLLIAGGDGKNQDFSPLVAAFTGKVRQVFTIGRDAPRIEAALAGVCPLERCATLEAAVLAALANSQRGTRC